MPWRASAIASAIAWRVASAAPQVIERVASSAIEPKSLASRVVSKLASAKARIGQGGGALELLASAIARRLASPLVIASRGTASRLASAVRQVVASPARSADVGETLGGNQ